MQKPKLLDQVRNLMRLRHLSHKTERAYVSYIREFILFQDKRHPKDMGADEVRSFLTHLAVEGNVAAATQNQAFAALLFLYRNPSFRDKTGAQAASLPRRLQSGVTNFAFQ